MKMTNNPYWIAPEGMAGAAMGQRFIQRETLVHLPNSNKSMCQPKYANAVAPVVNTQKELVNAETKD